MDTAVALAGRCGPALAPRSCRDRFRCCIGLQHVDGYLYIHKRYEMYDQGAKKQSIPDTPQRSALLFK